MKAAEPKPRVGLFGGSFDPIHNGHIEPVERARQEVGLDRVIYLPTARPPHKLGERFAPALSRYCMVEIALLEWSCLFVSDHELGAASPAYTVETIEHFARELPDCELFLFIGADSYLELDQWHRWQDLLLLAQLVVLERPGYSLSSRRQRWPEARIFWPTTPSVDLSSTQLRARLRAGESIGIEAMPAAVLDYVRKYRLYS